MQDATEKTILKNPRGRPKTDSTPVMVRLQPALLAALDAHIGDSDKSRPEAIRELIEAQLAQLSH